EFSKPCRAWCHALLDLDHVDDVEPKVAREVGPGVVIGDEARGAVSDEKLLPLREIRLEAGEKAVAGGDDFCGRLGRDADARLCNFAGGYPRLGGGRPKEADWRGHGHARPDWRDRRSIPSPRAAECPRMRRRIRRRRG